MLFLLFQIRLSIFLFLGSSTPIFLWETYPLLIGVLIGLSLKLLQSPLASLWTHEHAVPIRYSARLSNKRIENYWSEFSSKMAI